MYKQINFKERRRVNIVRGVMSSYDLSQVFILTKLGWKLDREIDNVEDNEEKLWTYI